MHASTGPGNGDLGIRCVNRLSQSGAQIERQARGVTRHGEHPWMLRMDEAGVQARERAGVITNHVSDHAIAESREARRIPVGVHKQFTHLRSETFDDMREQRASMQGQ